MKLIKATFEEFANHVKEKDRKIVLFGAGVMGRVLMPYIANKFNLDKQILACVDNNPAKWNRQIDYVTKKVTIYSSKYFEQLVGMDFCIVITNGDFESVVTQLEKIECLKEAECFLLPVMQVTAAKKINPGSVVHISSEPLIPKIIHYCWFSGNPIPGPLKKCINSWHEKCPDYEIIRWDESNYDVGKHISTKQAYEAGNWGFVTDVVRLELMYEFGGFYFDTDVELLKNLDELRFQPAFCGREEWGHMNSGCGFGCEKHFELVREMWEFRKDVPYLTIEGKCNAEASGYYETIPLMKRGLRIDNSTQTVDGMTIYSSEFFSPFNYISGTETITDNTFSIHYFSGSWLGEAGQQHRIQTRKRYGEIVSSMRSL